MEINLSDMVWPVCLLRCNESLNRLHPGDDLTLIVRDPDVVDNILLLVHSRPDLRAIRSNEPGSCRITVHCLHARRDDDTHSIQKARYERS